MVIDYLPCSNQTVALHLFFYHDLLLYIFFIFPSKIEMMDKFVFFYLLKRTNSREDVLQIYRYIHTY